MVGSVYVLNAWFILSVCEIDIVPSGSREEEK